MYFGLFKILEYSVSNIQIHLPRFERSVHSGNSAKTVLPKYSQSSLVVYRLLPSLSAIVTVSSTTGYGP